MQQESQQPRSWSDVSSSEQFRALPAEHQERARELYFQDVVLPRVPQGMERRARELFDEDTLGTPAAQASVAANEPGGVEAMDFAKEAGAGALIGTGSLVSGLGDAVRPEPQARQPIMTPNGEFMPLGDLIGKHVVDPVRAAIAGVIDGPAGAAGEWLGGKGKALAESKSEAAKQALQASTPTGDITNPSTWSIGEDPTLAGYGLHAANLAGQFVPQVGAIAATRGRAVQTPAMMAVGGLQAGGAAANEVEERISATPDGDLLASSALYRELRQSMGEQEAQQALAVSARNAAFDGAAPVGALGGLATQVAFGPLQNAIGGSVGRRLAGSLLIEAPGEGAQEVAETIEARRATNRALGEQRNTTEGTFGDFTLGALGGAGFSVVGTAAGNSQAVDASSAAAPQQPSRNTRGGRELGLLLEDEISRTALADDAEAQALQSLDPSHAQQRQDSQPQGLDLSGNGLVLPGQLVANELTSNLDLAAHEAATSPNNDLPEPTQAQKEAGNYKKGRIRVQGMDISIENPRGSERSGTGPDGAEWRHTMSDHYGYIKRTTGADGEQVDVYVGLQPDSGQVFVVDQLNQQDGSFDEHKVMLGYPDQDAAVAAYRANFDDGWQVGAVTAMPVDQFKAWLKEGDLSGPLAQKQPEAPAAQAQGLVLPGQIPSAAPAAQAIEPSTVVADAAGQVHVQAVEPSSGESAPAVPPRAPPVAPPTIGRQPKAPPRGQRRSVDRDRDSVVQAAIRLGGITTQWKQDTTGDTKGNKHVPGVGALWSDKTGTSLDDLASLLDQHGYVPPGEMDKDGGVSWLQDSIRDELAGSPRYAPDSAKQIELAEQELLNRYAEAVARAIDQREAEYARIEAEYGPDAAADARSFDEAAIAYNEQLDGALEDGREAQDTLIDGESVDQADATRRDDELRQADDRADRVEGEDAGEAFGLEQQTEAGLAEQDRQRQSREKAEEDARRQVEQKAQADAEVGDFTLTGSDRPADAWAARGQDDLFGTQSAREQVEVPVTQEDLATAYSLSAMKSVEANIRRGRHALARAVMERTSVHRAMHRSGLGWIDFVWGSEGRVKPSGKTAGAMGLSHILEARRRKDGASDAEALKLMDGVVQAIAQGEEFSRMVVGLSTRVGIEYDRTIVWMTRRKGNNAWVVTGYEKKPDGQVAGRATDKPTHIAASRTRDDVGAGGDRPQSRGLQLPKEAGRQSPETNVPTEADIFKADAEGREDIRYSLGGHRLQAGAVVSTIAAAPELAGIQVVQSFEDLPLAVRKRAERDGVAPGNVRGVFRPDGQYLVADNLDSLDDAVHTAVHEMVGHFGVRGVLGSELDATLERIYSSEAATEKGRQRIAQIREAYAEPLKRRSPAGQRLFVAEEIVAHLAESGGRPTVLQRFVSQVRAVLRRLLPQVRWTYNDILALIDQSRAWLRRQDGKAAAADEQHYALVVPAAAVDAAAPPSQGRLSTSAAQEETSLELPAETVPRRLQRTWQDKLNRFTVIKEWLAERGVTLREEADAYKAEERMHSRFANKAKDFREGTVRPMVEKIQQAGFSMDEVAQYLHAQHAQERNAQIAKINKQMPDGGSGMSNADARAILSAADPKLARLANDFRAITDRTRQVLLDAGLISKEMAGAWEKAYQHYVPLKGGPDGQAAQAGTGKGLSAKHKPKRALGHQVREEGEWIIENIIADHERALMAAEKNLVGRHLLKMAMDVGMDEIMTVGQPEKRGVLQNRTSYEVLYQGRPIGAFETLEGARTFKVAAPLSMNKATLSDFTIRQSNDPSVVYMASPMPAPNEALVYVDGQVIRIQINDDLLARAYNNLGVDALGTFMSVGRALNRWFSTVYTGYNPEFLVTNVIRDFTTGLANVTGEEGAVFAAKTAKNYFASFGSLLRYARKGTADQWVRQYREDGGNTGAAYLSDLERLGTDVQAEYAAYQGVLANLRKGSLKGAARAAGRRAFNATLRHIEALNEAGENAMRLALYRTAVEQGMTRNRAASLAKNTTVNFNRKGELGAQANALWLFFNAGVQGTTSIAHAHFKGQHKRQAWALSGAMAALGYSLALLTAGEDEDEYEKTPDHAKARNLAIPLGDGQSLTIPIPYGYGFFFNFGRLVADAQRTGEADGMVWQLAASFVGEFTPFSSAVAGDEPELAQAGIFLMPTMGQIPLSIAFNRTSFGGPMYPENSFKEFEPDRLKMWRGTEGTWADSLAGALEGVGMDVSPETLKHLNRTFTGGAGNFVGSTVDAVALGAQGAVPEVREVPFLRKFYRENGVGDARARFWRYQAKAKKAAEELERAIDAGDRNRVQALVGENRELIAMADVAQAFSEASGAVRDRVQEIRLGDLPVAEQREQIRRIEQRETELYDRFIGIFKARVQAQ